MSTQKTIALNLASPEVLAFARSADQVLVDPSLDARRAYLRSIGFVETGAHRRGPAMSPSDLEPGAVGITQAEIRRYDLVDRAGALHSQVETQVAHSQEVTLRICHELWLAPDLTADEAQRIQTAFAGYVDAPDTNPDDFATQNGISAYSYEAMAYVELTKTGQPVLHEAQDHAIRRHYSHTEEFRLLYRDSRFEELTERDDGAYEVSDPEDGTPLDAILDQIIGDSPATTCDGIKKAPPVRIATLLQYPEFKLEWRRHVIRLGCVQVSIRLPVMMYRNTKRVLYAVLAHPDVDAVVVNVLEYCLKKSALAGSVAGLATANIAVAGAAFKAVFTECVKQQIMGYLKCLLPELIILKERGGWRPV